MASLDAAIDETVITDSADEPSLARDMIEVHGVEAATVARANARAVALGGQVLRAKSWIRVLGMIQRPQAAKVPPKITDISLALKRTKVGFIYKRVRLRSVILMQSSPAAKLATDFKKWFIAHPPSTNDDDNLVRATPIALTAPHLDDQVIAPPEQPHRPWLVPGVGTL